MNSMKKGHFLTEKPVKCPLCNSTKIADYLYGKPSYCDFKYDFSTGEFVTVDLHEEIRKGKIVLGGCVIWDDSPRWRCMNCETDFIFKKK